MNEIIVDSRHARAPRTIYKRKHLLRWLSAVIVLALVAGVIVSLAQARINWPHVMQYLGYDIMLQAALNTVILAVAAQAVAVVLGVIIAVMRISKNPVASAVAVGYIWVFRGVPVLVQILVWYNLALVIDRVTLGIPFTDVVFFDQPTNAIMTAFMAALLGLALNESAYMAEIIRGGIKGIDPGQSEAAAALGMSPMRNLARIVLPQAMRIIIPPTGNNFINMLKTTSLASVITYFELVKAASNIASRNLEVMETLFAAATWYMIIVTVASVIQYYVERAFDSSISGSSSASLGRRVISNLKRFPFNRRANNA